MAIIDLYSKRQKRMRGEVSDVYVYDIFPKSFRVQLSHMVRELLGDEMQYHSYNGRPKEAYDTIVDILKKEYGQVRLYEGPGGRSHQSDYAELHNFFLLEDDVERCLDAVELCYRIGDAVARDFSYLEKRKAEEYVDDCIDELNKRFKEAGCGYEYIDGNIIRIDSQFLHAEIVKPAIGFLNAEGFEGARDEFLGAYEHYRHGNHKEALVDALKAFESTLKVVLTANGKPYAAGDTARPLVLACSKEGLIPSYNEAHLTSLVGVLTAGIPTVRNRHGGHGQGEVVKTVEPEVVAYGLHLTASAIVMLAGLESKRNRLAL